jgi:hypothetical protein
LGSEPYCGSCGLRAKGSPPRQRSCRRGLSLRHDAFEVEPSPWPQAQCQDYLRQAEAAAGVEKLEGGLWHAYRRKWATERKELPLKDVAAAGGWKDVTTLLTCYQHADEATMLKVMASPTKLVSRRAAGAVEKL